jgi:hypothetical protein
MPVKLPMQEFARNLAAQQAAAAQQQQQQQQSGVLAERMPSLATTSRGSVDMPATPAGVSTPLTGESEVSFAWVKVSCSDGLNSHMSAPSSSQQAMVCI